MGTDSQEYALITKFSLKIYCHLHSDIFIFMFVIILKQKRAGNSPDYKLENYEF